jgi:fermentation-respiration switch protein FrsA (DUF1100 family)
MRAARVVAVVVASLAWAVTAHAQATETVWLRGHAQLLRIYGQRGGPAAIVSSGDGGWIHLGPHVAETLAAHGYFVVGFDVKAYLGSFTDGGTTLRPEDEPGDYGVLAEFAARGNTGKPVLIGVSEGAGLSVMAAADPGTRARIGGVVGLGLPDVNELGWRWRDSFIYITHGTPKEPTFSAASLIGRATPVPIAAIHSTRDEYVPLAEVQRVLAAAREPKRLWLVDAADHRFSNNLMGLNQTLFEALAWLQGYGATT